MVNQRLKSATIGYVICLCIKSTTLLTWTKVKKPSWNYGTLISIWILVTEIVCWFESLKSLSTNMALEFIDAICNGTSRFIFQTCTVSQPLVRPQWSNWSPGSKSWSRTASTSRKNTQWPPKKCQLKIPITNPNPCHWKIRACMPNIQTRSLVKTHQILSIYINRPIQNRKRVSGWESAWKRGPWSITMMKKKILNFGQGKSHPWPLLMNFL